MPNYFQAELVVFDKEIFCFLFFGGVAEGN